MRMLPRLLRDVSVAVALVATPAAAQPVPQACVDGEFTSGPSAPALYKLCVPTVWNGDLVVYAHGYVNPDEPLSSYESQLTLPDGTSLPNLVQSLGFAFATTSYRKNGLAILEGVEDIRSLVAKFTEEYGGTSPGLRRVFVTGVSEGGLVAALAAERSPALFSGAYATCGPIGNFRLQINYFGDFRVLFDYFFPWILKPATPVTPIEQDVIDNWQTVYVPMIAAALAANPGRAIKLLQTARAPYDPARPETVAQTVLGLLRYNVFATNDARTVLGGNPFDNSTRWYFGSGEDLWLNLRVSRHKASPAAVAAMANYETSGRLTIPMVTLHTTADEIVPFGHELLYGLKVRPSGRGVFLPLPVARYGHCAFTPQEIVAGLGLLLALP